MRTEVTLFPLVSFVWALGLHLSSIGVELRSKNRWYDRSRCQASSWEVKGETKSGWTILWRSAVAAAETLGTNQRGSGALHLLLIDREGSSFSVSSNCLFVDLTSVGWVFKEGKMVAPFVVFGGGGVFRRAAEILAKPFSLGVPPLFELSLGGVWS